MPEVIWQPQPGPQVAFLTCPVYEICYGGARGGGKSDAALGHWMAHSDRYKSNAKGVFFRHTLPQLDEIITRSKNLFPKLGATYKEQDKVWMMPGGGELKFRHLERESDADSYQGHSYSVIYFEEATGWESPAAINRLRACLRSAAGVKVQLIMTCNPGGPGHHWVKERFIDPAPGGYKVIKDENNLERVYIPAKVQDNRKLLDADPTYVARLKTTGSPELVRAWLEGDWNVIEGAYFPEFGEKHIVRPVKLPDHWLRFRSFDWGSARPFCVHWVAVSDGTLPQFPKNALVFYREWYGAEGPNKGLKMNADEVALGIRERDDPDEKITYSVCDPACSKQDGGPSIMERMGDRGIHFEAGDNQRIPGWDQIRARLNGEDGKPMLYVFTNCKALIRTLPALQHDRNKPEDCDSDGEDHAPDSARYACMSRPYLATLAEKPRDMLAKPTLNELWEEMPKQSRRIA